jgi:hypothetical protein
MTAVGKWRARGYWTVAGVLLPLVNPPLVLWITVLLGDDTDAAPWIPVALCIALGNWLVLRLIAGRLWPSRGARGRRVPWGVMVAVALSFAFGYAELIAALLIACPDAGCWN